MTPGRPPRSHRGSPAPGCRSSCPRHRSRGSSPARRRRSRWRRSSRLIPPRPLACCVGPPRWWARSASAYRCCRRPSWHLRCRRSADSCPMWHLELPEYWPVMPARSAREP
ncbi:MAG: hypothetical protein E6G55_02065 [Actinobacteria bacterium]|nr:MAG: hypothetical protein E6G55_02065 [Actinomycetota bacterium]